MSAIIKGFDKPKNCFLCPFNNSDCNCAITKGGIDRDDGSCDKPCPIIGLPEKHGELIDKSVFIDALLKEVEESANNNDASMTFGLGYAVGVLTKCPIVIKAGDE